MGAAIRHRCEQPSRLCSVARCREVAWRKLFLFRHLISEFWCQLAKCWEVRQASPLCSEALRMNWAAVGNKNVHFLSNCRMRPFIISCFTIRSRECPRLRSQLKRLRQVTEQVLVYLNTSKNNMSCYTHFRTIPLTPCSVSLAIRQSPYKKGHLTQHQKPPRFKG